MAIYLKVSFYRQWFKPGHIALELCNSEDNTQSWYYNWPFENSNSKEQFDKNVEYFGDAVSITLPPIKEDYLTLGGEFSCYFFYSEVPDYVAQVSEEKYPLLDPSSDSSKPPTKRIPVQLDKSPYSLANNCADSVLKMLKRYAGIAAVENGQDFSKIAALFSPIIAVPSRVARVACTVGLDIFHKQRQKLLATADSSEKTQQLILNRIEILKLEVAQQRSSRYARDVPQKETEIGNWYAVSECIKSDEKSNRGDEKNVSASSDQLKDFITTNEVFDTAACKQFFTQFFGGLPPDKKIHYYFSIAMQQLSIMQERLQEAALESDAGAVKNLQEGLERNFQKLKNSEITGKAFSEAIQPLITQVQASLSDHPYSVTVHKNIGNIVLLGLIHGTAVIGVASIGFAYGFDQVPLMENFDTIVAGIVLGLLAMAVAQASISLLSLYFTGGVLPIATVADTTYERLDELTESLNEILKLHEEKTSPSMAYT